MVAQLVSAYAQAAWRPPATSLAGTAHTSDIIASMLAIRQSQLKIFDVELRERYEEKLVLRLLRTYPRECRQAGGADQIRLLVSDAVNRASEFGFAEESVVSLFIALQFILGRDFYRDPQLPWASALFRSPRIPNPALRLNAIYDRMLEYLEATAGENCELVVRALIRLRDWDLNSAPPVDGDWSANMLALLRTLYPQKFDHQGAESNGFLLDDSASRCEIEYRIFSAQGKALFAILMFMLGSGFDRDHLHPWAARVLLDKRISKEEDRVAALYQASFAHLEKSLTGD